MKELRAMIIELFDKLDKALKENQIMDPHTRWELFRNYRERAMVLGVTIVGIKSRNTNLLVCPDGRCIRSRGTGSFLSTALFDIKYDLLPKEKTAIVMEAAVKERYSAAKDALKELNMAEDILKQVKGGESKKIAFTLRIIHKVKE